MKYICLIFFSIRHTWYCGIFTLLSVWSLHASSGLPKGAHIGTYKFIADYEINDASTNTTCLIHAAVGAHMFYASKHYGDPISPGNYLVRVWQKDRKEGIEVVPSTHGYLRYRPTKRNTDDKLFGLMRSFGASLIEKFLPLDNAVRGKKIYKNISPSNISIHVVAKSVPHFKTFYQLRAKKYKKTVYVHLDTYPQNNPQEDQMVISSVNISIFHAGRKLKDHHITFLHKNQKIKKIGGKNFKIRKKLLACVKRLIRKNEHQYWQFYDIHKKLLQN